MTATPRSTITPYIAFRDAAKAIDFYKLAFGAEEMGARIIMPDGSIGHAQLQIGGSILMLSNAAPEMGAKAVEEYGGSPISISLLVDDVDAVTAQAEAHGARIDRPAEDQFYGDRTAWITDPFGIRWSIQTQIEELTSSEIAERAKKLFGKAG